MLHDDGMAHSPPPVPYHRNRILQGPRARLFQQPQPNETAWHHTFHRPCQARMMSLGRTSAALCLAFQLCHRSGLGIPTIRKSMGPPRAQCMHGLVGVGVVDENGSRRRGDSEDEHQSTMTHPGPNAHCATTTQETVLTKALKNRGGSRGRRGLEQAVLLPSCDHPPRYLEGRGGLAAPLGPDQGSQHRVPTGTCSLRSQGAAIPRQSSILVVVSLRHRPEARPVAVRYHRGSTSTRGPD